MLGKGRCPPAPGLCRPHGALLRPEAEEALLGRRDASSQNKWGESARWLRTEPTW